MKPVLFIVDDEESVRESFRLVLQNDYDLIFAANGRSALQVLQEQRFDLCLLDIMLPDGSGLDLLRQIKRRDEAVPVIMVTALSGVETALTAMKGEAIDYLTKPFKIEELRAQIQKALFQRERQQEKTALIAIGSPSDPLWLTGESKCLKNLSKKMILSAGNNEPIWLMGEKGTGINEMAREIHARGERRHGPFVVMDCSSFKKNQVARELFGEERTDQLPSIGKLEFAQRGTIFLKRIDRFPLAFQDKLLDILLKRSFRRLGGGADISLDVRLIVSSHTELGRGETNRLFLKKFYRYLSNCVISLPTLRERKSDIPLLIDRIVEKVSRRAIVPVKSIRPEVVQVLSRYNWPGNLEELVQGIESMVLYAGKDTLTMEDVPLDMLLQIGNGKTRHEINLSLKQVHYQFEYKYIRKVLENNLGNQTQTARILGLHRNTLIGKLKKLNLGDSYKEIVRKRRERGVGLSNA